MQSPLSSSPRRSPRRNNASGITPLFSNRQRVLTFEEETSNTLESHLVAVAKGEHEMRECTDEVEKEKSWKSWYI